MTVSFLAILREADTLSTREIRVSKSIQDSLQVEFDRQSQSFLRFKHRQQDDDGKSSTLFVESEQIPFFPIYTLNDDSQLFKVENYALDAIVLSAAKNPNSVDPLRIDDDTIPKIKAICAVYPARPLPRIYFQAFERKRLLSQSRFTFLQDGNAFSRLAQPGFTLGDSIQAIYDKGVLLFRSFAIVSRFINLMELFDEASNEKIDEVLSHSILHTSDLESVTQHADTVMRKQFAAISQLKVLDSVKPNTIKETAADFDIAVSVGRHDGKLKVEFPSEKKEQKELLKLLTEGYYKGPITGNKYQSNSHRPLQTKKAGKGK